MKISGIAFGELECERKNETLDVLFRLPIDRICEEHIKRLEADIDRLKHERDAAITHMEYIAYGDNPCMYCKKEHNCDGDPLHGTADYKCSVFEWAGV